MEPRIDVPKVAPDAIQAMLTISGFVHKSGLEENLANLMFLRASQLNGCAYCIDMHWKDLRTAGETEQRLFGLDGWRVKHQSRRHPRPTPRERPGNRCPRPSCVG